ncbi:hypothetical protein TWF281_010713 [Arthrobotrys megalospora]
MTLPHLRRKSSNRKNRKKDTNVPAHAPSAHPQQPPATSHPPEIPGEIYDLESQIEAMAHQMEAMACQMEATARQMEDMARQIGTPGAGAKGRAKELKALALEIWKPARLARSLVATSRGHATRHQ